MEGQKEKGKRSIWSETTVLIVSCWPFVGLRSKMPEDGPVLLHGVAPGGGQALSTTLFSSWGPPPSQWGTAEDRALSVSARVVTGPLDLLRVGGPSTAGIPSLPLYTWLGFRKIWDHLRGENAGFKVCLCPGLVTSHTVQAFLALPFLVPNRVSPPLPADASQSL